MTKKKRRLRPPVKIHGGKFYLCNWIIEKFPGEYEKLDYIEPFAGAGSVLLNKTPSEGVEVYNDLDLGMVQIFRALRDEPRHFISRLKRTRYTERVFNRELKREKSRKEFSDYMDHAIHEFILRRMSRGGLKKAFAWSDRKRGGQPGDVNAWQTIMRELPLIADRIKNCYVLNKPATEVIRAFSDSNTLCYCDPPYLHDVRTSTDSYDLEMTADDHVELAEALNRFRGKVILSGYPSPLYNRLFRDWRYIQRKIANHASQQRRKTIKTECLWLNY